ncbi:major facilitator superfamily domain-containing protein [Penicillium argentinense]|uniref:Major facilitator superfamily domain-containing protein n=1 Tax=Penicillium argentinense TaxID=1131581 RepID=A0A9W9FQ40_9EURO|nr:major facilitator superfamily domain-containing protein [Penicillium argentinense]KAJ5104224.1 major facilitator superfamily domain-containing protein [Penicillium argentinense]
MASKDSSSNPNAPAEWGGAVHGVRLYLGAVGLGLALFLTCLEATISKQLDHYIVSAHLYWSVFVPLEIGVKRGYSAGAKLIFLTVGFLIVWSNCSTILGVKFAVLASLFLFVVFSAGCAASQTLSQLIIFRAFQGLGGAGVYSLTLFSFVRIVPYKHFDKVSSLAGGISSLGLVLGPLLGGAIANSGSWRWVFLYNVPAGAISWVLIFCTIPSHFPNPPSGELSPTRKRQNWQTTKSFFGRVDIPGTLLTLSASSFIIAALQEGNSEYAWSSGLVISFFVIAGLSWFGFIWWEWFISTRGPATTPMFPWWLTQNRIFMGVILGFFTTGLPLFVCIINVPQRFQIVNGSTPIGAGVKLLSFSVSCPLGIIACSILAGRLAIPFTYITLAGIACEITGLFLYSEISPATHLWLGQFGYLVLAGLGVGLSVAAFYMAAPLVVDQKDQAAAVGIGIQFRTLGGVLGVAASTSILNHYLKSRLASILGPSELAALLKTTQFIRALSPDVQVRVQEVYALAYGAQMKLAGAFSVAQLLAVAMMWKTENVRFSKPKQSH